MLKIPQSNKAVAVPGSGDCLSSLSPEHKPPPKALTPSWQGLHPHIPGDIQTVLLAQRCLALPDAKQRVNSLLRVSRDIPSPERGATSPPSKQKFAGGVS